MGEVFTASYDTISKPWLTLLNSKFFYYELNMLNVKIQFENFFGVDMPGLFKTVKEKNYILLPCSDGWGDLFGIKKPEIIDLLMTACTNNHIKALVISAFRAALSQEDFINLLIEKKKYHLIMQDLEKWVGNIHILKEVLEYYEARKNVWPHLAIIQAVAEALKTDLRIWRLMDDNTLTPYDLAGTADDIDCEYSTSACIAKVPKHRRAEVNLLYISDGNCEILSFLNKTPHHTRNKAPLLSYEGLILYGDGSISKQVLAQEMARFISNVNKRNERKKMLKADANENSAVSFTMTAFLSSSLFLCNVLHPLLAISSALIGSGILYSNLSGCSLNSSDEIASLREELESPFDQQPYPYIMLVQLELAAKRDISSTYNSLKLIFPSEGNELKEIRDAGFTQRSGSFQPCSCTM